MTDLLLVGCGNMGFAMARGWMEAAEPPRLFVVDPSDALRARAEGLGAVVASSVEALPGDLAPDLIVLAVKPQIMGQVAPAYARFAGGSIFVSVAAGLSIASLEAMTGPAPFVRCMPNTPAAVGEGMMVCAANAKVDAAARAAIAGLLASSGEVAWVDEDQMDAVTAISGSGPAYVFHFIEALQEAGVALGLDPSLAKTLALQTVAGAGIYARASETAPGVLREQVTSPNGVTAEALKVLMGRLGPLVEEATRAARARSEEMGAQG